METWQFILQSLRENIPVILLYVLESKGSSPGRQGFCMAVNAQNKLCGSIGGGIMEYKFAEQAKAMLAAGEIVQPLVRRQVHDKEATEQSGMISSGEQTIFLWPLQQRDTATVQQLVQSLEQHEPGQLRLSPNGISFSFTPMLEPFWYNYSGPDEWELLERTGIKNRLYIIGGGHCALAFSALMRTMDFYITVLDERTGLHTMELNTTAQEKKVIENYTLLGDYITGGPDVYVVIMTFGYRTDQVALRALQHKSFRYLGVLGSKHKMKKLLEEWKAEGIDENWLNQVHTPIGIPVNSRTPAEIAVSIAAEIIREKNK